MKKKFIKSLLVGILALFSMMLINSQVVNYNFDDNTLQGWGVSWTNGDASAVLTPENGAMKASIGFNSGTDCKVDLAVYPDAFNLEGNDLVFNVFIPQAYLSSSYGIQLFVKDGNWNSAYNWIGLSSMTGDAYNEIKMASIKAASFSWNGGVDLANIRSIGIEFVQNGGPTGAFDFLLDNLYVAVGAPPATETILKLYDFNDNTTQGWGVSWTAGDAVGALTPESGAVKASVNYTAGTSGVVDYAVYPDAFNIEGKDLVFNVNIPQAYLSGGYGIQLFVKDGNWNSAYNWIGLSSMIGDANNEIRMASIKAASFSWNGGVDLANIRSIGIEFVQNGGPIGAYDFILDNIMVTEKISDGGGTEPPPGEIKNYFYDFEDGTLQGWFEAWGGAFDPVGQGIFYSNDVAQSGNNGSMKVNLVFTGGGWEEANVSVSLTDVPGEKVDLRFNAGVSYDIYLANPDTYNSGIFIVQTALNNSWTDVGPWENFIVANLPRVTINGVTYAVIHKYNSLETVAVKTNSEQLVIRLANGQGNYRGTVYIDNINVKAPTEPMIELESPASLDTITGTTTINAFVISPSVIPVDQVKVVSANGVETVMNETSYFKYEAQLDTTALLDGLQNLLIVVTSGSTTYSKAFEVDVKNSGIAIDLLTPVYDSAMSGIYEVKAQITNTSAFPINKVAFSIGYLKLCMTDTGSGLYSVKVPTFWLKDKGYVAVVTVTNGAFVTETAVDVMVDNTAKDYIVQSRHSQFVINHKPFKYVGWNAYDLPYKYTQTVPANTKAVIYTENGRKIYQVIPKGTVLTFEAQVDRSMIEAAKMGLSVVRLFAFNNDFSQEYSYYTSDWNFRESMFARFDYVMDSAKRHGVKVILVLQNYWDDKNGIKAMTDKIGVPKLAFFTNPETKQMYKDYAAHFINRVNTVNGVAYKNDPTVFSWELMNEPRMASWDDTSADKSLWDPTGAKLGAWFDEMSTYIKSLDPQHMVSTGTEGHGFSTWGGNEVGYGNDPIGTMDQPNIDFFTIHPYWNTTWFMFTQDQAKEILSGFVKDGLKHKKPVIMEEYGIDKTQPVVDTTGAQVLPGAETYDAVREEWYRLLLGTFRKAGGNGSNIWMLQTNNQETHYGVSVYTLANEAEKDRNIAQILIDEAKLAKCFHIPYAYHYHCGAIH